MWASVSAQANVLSETWVPNLDLTIPSSEMQSTSVLDSKAKQEIMLGWTCCYRKELINAVQMEHSQKSIESMLKESQRKSQYTLVEPITNLQWASFVSLQLFDIYTTYRGLQYDCVKELNPLVGERPSVQKMFFVKTVILTPALQHDMKRNVLTPRQMDEINLMMALVIGNNYNVWRRADKRCNKR